MWQNLDSNSALSSKLIIIMIILSFFALDCVVDYITQAKRVLVKIRRDKCKIMCMKSQLGKKLSGKWGTIKLLMNL